MAEEYKINLHLSNELRIAIGDITAHWSFLEWQVSRIMHKLLDLDAKRGRIVSTQMNIRPRVECVKLLMQQPDIDATIVKEFDDAAKEIERRGNQRNQIIHGIWAKKKGDNEHYLLWYGGKAQNRITGKAKPMTLSKAAALSAQIQVINLQLARIFAGLQIGALPPSPKK